MLLYPPRFYWQAGTILQRATLWVCLWVCSSLVLFTLGKNQNILQRYIYFPVTFCRLKDHRLRSRTEKG